MKTIAIMGACLLMLAAPCLASARAQTTRVPNTGQVQCYNAYNQIPCPRAGQAFWGQDAQYQGAAMAFRDNGDGTVSDLVTGLMWSKAVDTRKVTPEEAESIARSMTLGGHRDWRVPNIKELYSLIDFRGYTGFSPSHRWSKAPANAVPFINTDYFDFRYGGSNERYIDAQWVSRTLYVSTTMQIMTTMFGVNFADGRIKGYGYKPRGGPRVRKRFYARYVRGPAYGINKFVDNHDGTITDLSTGLMWAQKDNGKALTWQEALAFAANLRLAGHHDWRLPNVKELQYIVDYTRSPDTTGSAAMAPVFQPTAITNQAGQRDFPRYWSSTTHLDGPQPGRDAAYVDMGRALGRMRGRIMDVHGSGAQRSDPKSPPVEDRHAPQGDIFQAYNYVLCVRGGGVKLATTRPTEDHDHYPYKIRVLPSTDVQGGGGPGPGPGGFGRPGPGADFGLRQGGFRGFPGPGQGAPPPRGFVRRLDRDGDGRVSRTEFDGLPDQFDFLDANHDGYLSEDEAPRVGPGTPGNQ